MKTRKDFASFL